MHEPEIIHNKYKILTIGESDVGKTSILQTLSGEPFQTPMSTIGIDVVKKYIHKNEKNILLQIWDTAGQERFKSITKNFYRDADGILIVSDMTDLNSLNKIPVWHGEVIKEISNQNEFSEVIRDANVNKVPIFMIGNKYDLLNEHNREQRENMFKEKAKSLGADFYLSSAKTGLNIEKIFSDMTDKLLATNKNRSTEYLEFKPRRKRRWGCF